MTDTCTQDYIYEEKMNIFRLFQFLTLRPPTNTYILTSPSPDTWTYKSVRVSPFPVPGMHILQHSHVKDKEWVYAREKKKGGRGGN